MKPYVIELPTETVTLTSYDDLADLVDEALGADARGVVLDLTTELESRIAEAEDLEAQLDRLQDDILDLNEELRELRHG